jgi:hypothetical protein
MGIQYNSRGELSYLAPLGSELSWGGGGGSNAHLCQNACSICGGGPIVPACENAMRVKRRVLFDRVGVFMADIIFIRLSLLFCL